MSEAQVVREEEKTRQYDPGYYTAAVLAFPNAYLDVFAADPVTGIVREVWCLFNPIWGQHGPGALQLVTLTSMKVQSEVTYPPPPPANFPFPHPGLNPPPPGSHIHEVACKEMTLTPAEKTGMVTTPPIRPQPVRVGHYRLEQGGKRVGELIVEPSSTGDTVQHWFLCKTAPPVSPDAPYKAPDSNPSPMDYRLLDLNVNGIPLKAFGDSRQFLSYTYIFGPVTFRTTTP